MMRSDNALVRALSALLTRQITAACGDFRQASQSALFRDVLDQRSFGEVDCIEARKWEPQITQKTQMTRPHGQGARLEAMSLQPAFACFA